MYSARAAVIDCVSANALKSRIRLEYGVQLNGIQSDLLWIETDY